MKKILFLGDSITEGAGASDAAHIYHAVVGKTLGCEVVNYGIGGTRIARQLDRREKWDYGAYVDRVVGMDKDADFVVVFGGTNDYGHGDAQMGEADSHDLFTFCGAMNVLCEFLVKTYGKDKVVFIIPIPRYNENDPRGEGKRPETMPILEEYREAERVALKKYGIDMLDLSHLFPTPVSRENDPYTIDGLHPNDHGHNMIAEEIIKYLEDKKSWQKAD